MNPPVDARLGRRELSFREPSQPVVMIVLGGIIIFATILLWIAVAASRETSGMTQDDWIGVGICTLFVAGGVAFLVAGLRAMKRKPEWHLHEYGALRTWNGGADAPLYWANIPEMVKVQRTSGGRPVGFHLDLGNGKRIDVPNMETADRAHALWRAVRRAPAMREIT